MAQAFAPALSPEGPALIREAALQILLYLPLIPNHDQPVPDAHGLPLYFFAHPT